MDPDLYSDSDSFADEEAVDTDFVHHLVRGAEMLQDGEADSARAMLEQALALRPKNQRGQNLLALSYFKLGLFDRAEAIYQSLVTDYADDASLRVNLGLVQLKMSRYDEAILSFSSALDITPDHKKAQNYLGLCYMHKRDHARAKEWFEKAGSISMSQRMSLEMANQPLKSVGAAGLRMLDREAVPFSAPETTPLAPQGAWIATKPASLPDVATSSITLAVPDLASFAARNKVEPLQASPFAVSDHMVVIDVRDELYARVDGLVATFGNLDIEPSMKRFRGRVTDKPFGEGDQRMMRVSGVGRLWVSPGKMKFFAIEITEEAAYFREDVLFAFEESLLFENGRVPSKYSTDLQLVHLRNQGRILVAANHRPRSIEIVKDEPVRVPPEILIGWYGNVAPRVVPLAGDSEGLASPAVELSGEGRAFLDAEI